MRGTKVKQLIPHSHRLSRRENYVPTDRRITQCGCGKTIIITEESPWRDCKKCISRKVNDRVKVSS